MTSLRTRPRAVTGTALTLTALLGGLALAGCSGAADPGSAGAGSSTASTPAASSGSPSASASTPAAALAVTSTSYAEGAAIPAALTCDGGDTSPQLSWSGAPSGTVGYAVAMTDPDADGFVHWLVANLPAGLTSLDEGAARTLGKADGPAPTAVGGLSSFGRTGYRGPCPPSGTHHYVVTVYALGSAVDGTPTLDSVQAAAVASGTLTGTYAAQG